MSEIIYREYNFKGKRAILTYQNRPSGFKMPNFDGTGLALVCFLKHNQTMEDYLKQREKRLSEIETEIYNEIYRIKSIEFRQKKKNERHNSL